MTPLDIGQRVGGERLLLWLPMTITHVIDETSPLYNWKDLDKASQDCDATIVVWVSALNQQGILSRSDIDVTIGGRLSMLSAQAAQFAQVLLQRVAKTHCQT